MIAEIEHSAGRRAGGRHVVKICPTCNRPLPDPRAPRRVCARCGGSIGKHHKWGFNEDGRAQHRDCNDPERHGGLAPEIVKQQELPVEELQNECR